MHCNTISTSLLTDYKTRIIKRTLIAGQSYYYFVRIIHDIEYSLVFTAKRFCTAFFFYYNCIFETNDISIRSSYRTYRVRSGIY